MKSTELIKDLQAQIEKRGDLDVAVETSTGIDGLVVLPVVKVDYDQFEEDEPEVIVLMLGSEEL